MSELSAARACRSGDQRKDRRASDLEVSDKEREVMPSARGLFTRPPRILRSLGGRLVVCREADRERGHGRTAHPLAACTAVSQPARCEQTATTGRSNGQGDGVAAEVGRMSAQPVGAGVGLVTLSAVRRHPARVAQFSEAFDACGDLTLACHADSQTRDLCPLFECGWRSGSDFADQRGDRLQRGAIVWAEY
jgi:hypothetical protein